jgi:hypothetical protein
LRHGTAAKFKIFTAKAQSSAKVLHIEILIFAFPSRLRVSAVIERRRRG